MSIQRNDWSLQRKGIIDQERHKERVREAIKKNLGSIVSNEAIILSDGKRKVKVPIRSLDEYKFRFDHNKKKHVGQGDGKTKVGDVIAREGGQQQGSGKGSGPAGKDGGAEYYEAEVNIDELAAHRLPLLAADTHYAVLTTLRRWSAERVSREAHLVKHPTLLLWGDDDRAVPLRHGLHLLAEMPAARLFVFRRCGHLPQEEYPQLFTALVSEFCRASQASRSEARETVEVYATQDA